MTPLADTFIVVFAALFMTLGFLSLLLSLDRPQCSLQERLLPGVALTFVGAFLFALPLILAK